MATNTTFLQDIKSAISANTLTDTRLAHVTCRLFGLACNNGEAGLTEVAEGMKVLIDAAPMQARRVIKAVNTLSSVWFTKDGKPFYQTETNTVTIDPKTGEVTLNDAPEIVYALFKERNVTKKNMWYTLAAIKAEKKEQEFFTDEELIEELFKGIDRLYKNKRTTTAQRQSLKETLYNTYGKTCPQVK